MTAQPDTPPQPAPHWYTPQPGSRAEQLLDQLDGAKAAEAEAKAHVKSLVESIEAEVAADIARELDGAQLPVTIHITGTAHRKTWIMRWVSQWRVDARRMKEERPDIYAYYATQSSYWKLSPESSRS